VSTRAPHRANATIKRYRADRSTRLSLLVAILSRARFAERLREGTILSVASGLPDHTSGEYPSTKRDSCRLLPSTGAPARARTFVAEALSGWGAAERFADVPLVTSELVTNAVQHAGSEVVVSVALGRDCLRLEVFDLSEEPPVKGELADAQDGGWGLHIVEILATRWGLERGTEGKTVWCELATPAA
jgi:anti-sigma regulatory factor (Ser/Thr protein kinase)